MSFNGRDIPWWLFVGVGVCLIIILIVAYYA
jgi:hypothetical protein